ncbi:hypothetical protein AJ80_06068 [Polytolypa hystricis UAMH7299]|uniref:Uncharacterized protein n=1 Tax=Polytolypa hystricis (strain UAMH7299) TaxID=1447883 RepID=A0A2B7XQM4_POLH7|nr:hypothetical protein AJ80_06068 [Polytolypa hystricis UAMH7299]
MISSALSSLRRTLTPSFTRRISQSRILSSVSNFRSFSIVAAGRSTTRNGLLSRLSAAQGLVSQAVNGSVWLGQVRGMKTRSSVKRLCDGCKVGCFLPFFVLKD